MKTLTIVFSKDLSFMSLKEAFCHLTHYEPSIYFLLVKVLNLCLLTCNSLEFHQNEQGT